MQEIMECVNVYNPHMWKWYLHESLWSCPPYLDSSRLRDQAAAGYCSQESRDRDDQRIKGWKDDDEDQAEAPFTTSSSVKSDYQDPIPRHTLLTILAIIIEINAKHTRR